MKKNKESDPIIICGAGVAGLGVAIAFLKQGKKVLVIDREGLSGQASSLAAGILDPVFEMSLQHPLFPLSREAFDRFPKLVQSLQKNSGVEIHYQKTGMLYVAFSKPEEDELRKRFNWQKKAGVDIVWKNRDQVLKTQPLMEEQVRCGVFYPATGKVHAASFMDALRKYAIKLGVQILNSKEDVRLLTHEDRLNGIQVSGQTLSASVCVNSTGAWSGINAFLSLGPRIQPARGQIAIVKSPMKISTIIHSLDGAYLVPWPNGQYLLGSTLEFVGFKPYVTDKGIRQVIGKIQRLIPHFENFEVVKTWAGLRPAADDYLPVIGPSKLKGLFMANGYYRSGILIGAHAGELIAQSILKHKWPKILKPFSPKRNNFS